ncbi:hypothetical protein AB4510_06245 [Vibrio sp. 10N.222.54.B12]|jgi:hypothetical protein|uniref:Uncharacterized protein n=2 Tax=Vibrio cyclitrophicus TaxID=47951 RepID=A0A7Z1MMN7_9VIBR|nr:MULTISPECIES: hypothetical protein [Vibrio]PML64715.1 hypothetical protein BCT81_06615 [Vibrio sp. 10N.261.52.A1]PMP18515.1 hypothetical protein BCS91_24180 [Vibrio cyclitrophicus]PMP33157.1 hypothetical protein BCS90_00105 [Vibrio cyclitrophicus]TKG12244.1 hypothetical protein FCV67_00525 [Vibrio sp. F13]
MIHFLTIAAAIWVLKYLMERFQKSRVLVFITGIVGVPLHELGHYLMCKLVGFKVTEVKLFQMPTQDNPVLGYVNYEYPMTISGSIRKVIVSIGPIFTGIVALYFLSPQVTPYLFNNNTIDLTLFMNKAGWQQWFLIWVLSSVTLHMLPSLTDIKIAMAGSLWIGVFTYVGLIYAASHTTTVLSSVNIYLEEMAGLMSVGAIIATVPVAITLLQFIFSTMSSRMYNKSVNSLKRD